MPHEALRNSNDHAFPQQKPERKPVSTPQPASSEAPHSELSAPEGEQVIWMYGQRQDYAKAEAAVNACGTAYLGLATLILGMIGLSMWIAASGEPSTPEVASMPEGSAVVEARPAILLGDDTPMVVGGIAGCLSLLYFLAASGLRRYRPWARALGILLALPLLLNIPLGTIIGMVILVTLLSSKGSRVFQPDYQQVMATTGPAEVRPNLLVTILLILMLAMMAYSWLPIILVMIVGI